MFHRLNLGLHFGDYGHWIGGMYYVKNLVLALATLPSYRRPHIVVISDDQRNYAYLRSETAYPDLTTASLATIQKAPVGGGSHRFLRSIRNRKDIDVILLGASPGLEERTIRWVPDFQEERFPEFFPQKEVATRHRRNADWFSKHRHVMVTSKDVYDDYIRYYGRFANAVHIVRYASFIDRDFAKPDARALRARYALPGRFFICNNQLWRHKNHGVVLRALAEQGSDQSFPSVVFTGHEHDYRDPGYAPSVKALAEELGVADRARFLGFIPRGDQLGLMSNAIAVIQPSLCEGWSTVVEDAKALGQHVIASDIAVHREQLASNVEFFNPNDHAKLAEILRSHGKTDPLPRPIDYDACKRRFAKGLFRMLVEVDRDYRQRLVERFILQV